MSNELHSQNKSTQYSLRLPDSMRKELEEKAGMDFISLNSAIVMRLAKCLREEKANAA
ncbi:Arc family DNA-binding protein [Xenorhabdus bovienii]|uniref:Arc family DNA-binding protein n=1 Tax=Xenorhabdus bovienii TaxID=40576 RepID=UPI00237CC64E|nr:Arc family DNA-binding protein [Xenorhabdus bovienii]MDE1487654.1 Arc family DNA-binding protein [Xenorhabdus bovienii]MDE9478604.1 Arc family DNA-binding protein [Xenorhabdus bovienii]MDE9531843.1 Arc family DNA-binding protein [Xenorhabdus bovienii]MDE9536098.1 Arc family DNA-binding protein [Xenorhabdus bovienii]MDE9557663.1 Arc family DNA-binding protein [Xenorhabdus bovienii]